MDRSDCCVVCKSLFEESEAEIVTLTEKGSNGINNASGERNNSSVKAFPGQRVHKECRRIYCNPNKISQAKAASSIQEQCNSPASTLRSAVKSFNFTNDCLFCGTEVDFQKERKRSNGCFKVTTLDFKDILLKDCMKREDQWSDDVKGRIIAAHDLPAADAIYHQTCSVNFRTGKSIPQQYCKNDEPLPKKKCIGRPASEVKSEAFLKVAQFFEQNDDEQVTINDLIERMEVELENSQYDAYGRTYMKAKLKEYFGSDLIITEINGKSNVVTLKSTADSILQSFHTQQTDPSDEKGKIIRTAAKLILSDIKSVKTTFNTYPGSVEFKSAENALSFLPVSLRVFLECIILKKNPELKVASIGQAIMQAARPRVLLAPLQVGLGVQLHHHFASRLLIDSLNAHGFCCSYHEVQKFNKNAAVCHGSEIPGYTDQFIQYVADNVDHNIRTLDGNDTFHGMGIIATVTPAVEHNLIIPRNDVSLQEITNAGQIPIMFQQAGEPREPFKYRTFNLESPCDTFSNLDMMWKLSLVFCHERPLWSGFVQSVTKGVYPGKSSVKFLPMLDMNSSDPTCIFSTLKFIAEHAERHSLTPVLTFDQPLWWKAMHIIASESEGSKLHNIVLRLGGFHAEMSFLGAIGHLMMGSGLEELLQQIYAVNAVKHITSGKAVSRAIRGHFIVDAALNTMLFSAALDIPITDLSDDRAPLADSSLQEVSSLLHGLLDGSVSAEEISIHPAVEDISKLLCAFKDTLKGNRTASLWLQYMDMVDVLRRFIRAERIGDWDLHLKSLSDMLPYLAASGHNLYVKSLWLYLQAMSALSIHDPVIHEKFKSGYHVARRSSRFWAGLSTDLVIEQVLMRSLKTSGGLTRGRGMTEQQRVIWLLSMPACAEVNSSMRELTNIAFSTSEQNQDQGAARQARDLKDTNLILSSLNQHNPFSEAQSLRNIVNGIVADEAVDVDKAVSVGKVILSDMEEKEVASYVFKKKNAAKTLGIKPVIKIDGESVYVDPQLLFQRLLIASESMDNMEAVFQFELCSYPPSLFDEYVMMRSPKKSVLADALWKLAAAESVEPRGQLTYVLDGGALLHRVPWVKGCTFEEIFHSYCNYVQRKYGAATIVFDGYGEASTKGMTQSRRAKGKTCADIVFSSATTCTVSKDLFLSNPKNKQSFINLLSNSLSHDGCKTIHAEGDADSMIVSAAIECSQYSKTVLVGDDTDLLALLCFHTTSDSFRLFFKPEPKKNSKKNRIWDIKQLQQSLGLPLCQNILFLHAILGCDTTSHLFSMGKGHSLKLFQSSSHFREQAAIFMDSESTQESIMKAGETALVLLYGGKMETSLDALRYQKYCEKVATNHTQVHPRVLPPSSNAARFHSLRVFYQVQVWKGNTVLTDPKKWGWELTNGHLKPKLTSLPPAPADLLRVIRCNCSASCGSSRCTCKRHKLDCSSACGQCKGVGCQNSPAVEQCVELDT